MSSHPDLYAVLGLAPSATTVEIEGAYQRLAADWDPGRFPADTPREVRELLEERVSLLNRARRELSDPERRRAFDQARPSQERRPATETSVSAESPHQATRDRRPAAGRRRLGAWLALVSVLAAAAYVAGSADLEARTDGFYRYETAVVGTLTYLVLGALFLLIARGLPLKDAFALRSPPKWRWALVAGACIVAGSFIFDFLYGTAFGPFDPAQGLPEHWDGSRAGPFLANLLLVAAVAPVVEELAFRGLGYRLLQQYGAWSAIGGTAILFGLLHGYVTLLPVFLVSGIALGWLRSRTGSVFPGILVHVVFNAAAVALTVTLA